MKESDKKKRKKLIIDAVIIAVIVAIVAIIIVLLTYRKETTTIDEYDSGDASALVCKSHDNEDTIFFYSDTATQVEHVVKLVYNNDKLAKMSYEYEGKYNTDEEAKKDSGELHTRYNLYLGEHNIKHELLNPVFQYTNDKARITLYLDDYKKMNSVVAKIFYIGNGMIETIGKNSAKETKKIYENKGFSCIIND